MVYLEYTMNNSIKLIICWVKTLGTSVIVNSIDPQCNIFNTSIFRPDDNTSKKASKYKIKIIHKPITY